MEILKIPNAPKTPGIDFNPVNGKFIVSGISVPENARAFYEPVISWLKEYVKRPAELTNLAFKLSYINTSSLQFIYDLLMFLDGMADKNLKVSIDWYHLEEDIDMQEIGEDFRDANRIDFNFFGVENI